MVNPMDSYGIPLGSGRTTSLIRCGLKHCKPGRVALFLSMVLWSCALPASGQNPVPAKEYIRLGSRVIAIENAVITVTVTTPPRPVIAYGETEQFSATVSGTPNSSVTWSATVGTIDVNTGNYTASMAPQSSSMQVTVTATSVAIPTISGTFALTVSPIFLPWSDHVGSSGVTGHQVNVSKRRSRDQDGLLGRLRTIE